MILKKASLEAIRYSCQNFHYSKSVPVNSKGFSVFNDEDEWCGCIIFSVGANPKLANKYNLKMGEVVELTRVALNGKQKITSKALSLSMKLIKRFMPTVRLLISFADQNQNHIGIIYQSTNWYYTGIAKSTPLYLINNRWVHQRQLYSLGYSTKVKGLKKRMQKDKYRYIYPIDKKLINLCESLKKDYPKNADIAHMGERLTSS